MPSSGPLIIQATEKYAFHAGPAMPTTMSGMSVIAASQSSAPAAAYAYELARGSAPNGRAIEQRCGEGRCVNPEHLRPVPPVP